MAVNRPRTTDELLTGKLVLLGRLLSQSASAVYRRRYRLGQEEWRIVARLGSQESLPLKELGRRASLRKSQISRAVASLIAKRLLSRSIGEDDAREARLHLTARGRRVQQGIVRTAARRSDYLARTMTAKEVLTLQRQLDGLLVRASELLRESE